MHDINKDIELSKYRYSLAEQTYNNAKMCLENGFYRDCINRSYYAVFYAIRAVLALESIDFKRHKDVVAYFNKEFVANYMDGRDKMYFQYILVRTLSARGIMPSFRVSENLRLFLHDRISRIH